jgi:integrase
VIESENDFKHLNLTELDRLIAEVPDTSLGEMEAVMYRTAAMTGLRQGEILGLRWRDVDWLSSKIRVRQSFVRGRFDTPKTRRSHRAVPLADRVARELELHYRRSPWKADDDLVFSHPNTGRPYDRSKLLKRFKKARDAAGISRGTWVTATWLPRRNTPTSRQAIARRRSSSEHSAVLGYEMATYGGIPPCDDALATDLHRFSSSKANRRTANSSRRTQRRRPAR